MKSQICWYLPHPFNQKILHLRLSPQDPWQPYTSFPEYCLPDYEIKAGSKGYHTMQVLLAQGWELVPSNFSTSLSDYWPLEA
ncbi:hypothetical protein [Nostoc sp.]|uniref:hypothetical protein n=1 Tax=Nostoc sp. TaxID=1180 RepID=UPI002FF7EF23